MAPEPPSPGRRRVATLLPAATEIACALGLRDALVGVSHECDFPPGVRGLPVLTTTRLRPLPQSGAIDREVRDLVRDTLGVYEVDALALERAAPDVVVTQDVCDVCAVPLDAVRRAVSSLARRDVEIIALHPTRLEEVWNDIRRVAAALGVPDRAETLLAGLHRRMDAVAERAARLPKRPRVLAIEWIDPPMVAGCWMPELIELAGGVPLAARAGERAPTLSLEDLARLEPEIVLFTPCGFDLERSQMEIDAIEALIAPMDWPAALAGEVFLADGSAFFNRPGPRLADSLEILAACIHGFEFRELAKRHAGAFVRLAQHGRG